MSTNVWYYVDRHQERQGPVDAEIIREAYRGGQIDGESLVWREGMSQWAPLKQFELEFDLEDEPTMLTRAPAMAPTGFDADAPTLAYASPYAPPMATVASHVDFDGVRLDRTVLGVGDAGLDHLRLTNPTDAPARVMLLGGEPFDEGVVMWWNFIGRSHEDIVTLRQEWNDAPEDRFGQVAGYRGATQRLAAPPLPADLRLKRRFRRGRQ